MANKRPIPDDFTEVANRLKQVTLIEAHYKAGDRTVAKWCKEVGYVVPKRIVHPIPDDFAEQTKAKHTLALIKHYNVSGNVVRRWLRETGIKPINGRVEDVTLYRLLPPCFPENAAVMSRTALRHHYKTGLDTLARWYREAGLEPIQYKKPSAPKGPKPPKPTHVYSTSGRGRGPGVSIREKHWSVYDEAADVLRKYGPVSRCDENGKYQQAGDYWRVGWVVITPQELLERGERKRSKAA